MTETTTPAERIIAAAREAQAEVRQTTRYIGNDLAVAKVQALALADAVVTLAEAGRVLADEIAAYREGWSDWDAVTAAWDAHQAALERAATELEATDDND